MRSWLPQCLQCWNPTCTLSRGSPIGFSGSGIWLIWTPGFRILEKTGKVIWVVILNGTKELTFLQKRTREMSILRADIQEDGKSVEENRQSKSSCNLHECRKLTSKMFPRPINAAFVTPMVIFCLFLWTLVVIIFFGFNFASDTL